MIENFKVDNNIHQMAQAYSLDAIDFGESRSILLDWSDKSIVHVEHVLKNLNDHIEVSKPSEADVSTFSKMFGSYVGEVFRKNHGATWGMITLPGQELPGLKSDGGAGLFWPWGRVQNRIINGPEDNVWHYYQALVENNKNNDSSVLRDPDTHTVSQKTFWKKLFSA